MTEKIDPWIHENNVGLKKDKEQSQDDIGSNGWMKTWRLGLVLHKGQHFNEKVSKGSKAKDNGTKSHCDTSMAFGIFNDP